MRNLFCISHINENPVSINDLNKAPDGSVFFQQPDYYGENRSQYIWIKVNNVFYYQNDTGKMIYPIAENRDAFLLYAFNPDYLTEKGFSILYDLAKALNVKPLIDTHKIRQRSLNIQIIKRK